MNRRRFLLGALLAALFAASPAQAQVWDCEAGRPRPPDCGQFPHDGNIMIIPPGENGVVARWYRQNRHFVRRQYREGDRSPVRGIRIFNNLDRPLPIFLRTRAEFNAFMEFTEKEPGVSTCKVVNGTWYFQHCVDANGRPEPCPWRPGVHYKRELFHCHGVDWSCGGRCWGAGRGRTVITVGGMLVI